MELGRAVRLGRQKHIHKLVVKAMEIGHWDEKGGGGFGLILMHVFTICSAELLASISNNLHFGNYSARMIGITPFSHG